MLQGLLHALFCIFQRDFRQHAVAMGMGSDANERIRRNSSDIFGFNRIEDTIFIRSSAGLRADEIKPYPIAGHPAVA